MNIHSLTATEIKLHDARRQLEGLIDLSRMDIPLPNDDIIELQHQISALHRQVLNFYLEYNRDVAEEITLETPSNNVVEFPKKKED